MAVDTNMHTVGMAPALRLHTCQSVLLVVVAQLHEQNSRPSAKDTPDC
jgi:hypothetical protein